jgi:flotillin
MIPWSVIAARKAAETSAMPITVMAEAEKQAATNRAEVTNVLAKADANTTRAAGVKALGQAEAEVATLKAETRNELRPSMIDYDLNLARINIIPNALAEAVKPIIDKILTEAGFAAGPDALTSLTNALPQKTPDASPIETPATPAEAAAAPPTTISGAGKATLGPKT